MLLIVYFPGEAVKVLHFGGIIAFLAILSYPQQYLKNRVWLISLPLFVLAIVDLSWYETFKFSGSVNLDSYRGHLDFGKNALFSSVALMVVTNSKITKIIEKKYYLIVAVLSQFMALAYAVYQHHFQGIERSALALENGANATGAAYTITFLTLFSVIAILYSGVKHKNLYFLSSFAVGFYTVSLTGTRAALITLPVLCLAMFICYARVWGKFGIKKGIISTLVIIVCLFATKNIFVERYDNLMSDINMYHNNDSNTSFGARLAMWEAGYISADGHLFWESTEKRNDKIKKLANQNRIYEGALPHMHAHLHNDFIETLSLKGWSGVFIWLLFFAGAIKLIFTVHEKYALLIYFLGVFIYGLADVMFFSKNISLGWLVPLILILSYLSKKNDNKGIG